MLDHVYLKGSFHDVPTKGKVWLTNLLHLCISLNIMNIISITQKVVAYLKFFLEK